MSLEELQQQVDDLKSDNKRLLRDLEASKSQTTRLEGQLREADGARKDLESARATAESARESIAAELKDAKSEARERGKEAKELGGKLAELTTDRDTWRTKAEQDPEGQKKKVEELTGRLRGMTHRQAFERVARAHRVTDETRLNDLWDLSKYTPADDAIDEAKLSEVITGTLSGRSYLLDQPTTSTSEPGGSTPATGASATAAAAATHGAANGNGTHANGVGASKPGPGADRGQSLAAPTTQPPARIPGKF